MSPDWAADKMMLIFTQQTAPSTYSSMNTPNTMHLTQAKQRKSDAHIYTPSNAQWLAWKKIFIVKQTIITKKP